ncbi:hypothetical protein [Parasphingopyxis marina]|uniref:Uncharacterized protein n=1 Tax=Parasphingopyxis marina TaxID=2761622 RepID=A0A842I067_9SPHN|nr:hypothetical protein [Parasphingopyxis marina]MBC2778029.1 hypothetical protein [Parasphingopyxis marina]
MSLGPTARRYWFADRAGLDTLAAAIDPPDWDDADLPMIVFCDDDSAKADIAAIAPDVAIHPADAFAFVLAGETADYVQLAFRAVEDFGPGLELAMERLESGEADCLTTAMLAVSQCTTMPCDDGEPPAEACWVKTERLRAATASDPGAALAEARQAAPVVIHLPIVAGAVFTGEPGDEAAQWRARAAASHAENDRLRTERRVRLGREAALKARHERDLSRQAERSREEIERLHQAAGWAGRWKARLARIFGSR